MRCRLMGDWTFYGHFWVTFGCWNGAWSPLCLPWTLPQGLGVCGQGEPGMEDWQPPWVHLQQEALAELALEEGLRAPRDTATLLPSRQGLTFVSVHDCYWTHACSVDMMNQVTRLGRPLHGAWQEPASWGSLGLGWAQGSGSFPLTYAPALPDVPGAVCGAAQPAHPGGPVPVHAAEVLHGQPVSAFITHPTQGTLEQAWALSPHMLLTFFTLLSSCRAGGLSGWCARAGTIGT